MNIVTIYKYGTIVPRAVVKPDTNSQQSVKLMGEDTLTLNFTVADKIDFSIGDYCYFFNKLYQVNKRPKRSLTAQRKISYSLVLESEMYDLGKVEFMFFDAANSLTQSIFSFRGKPKDFGDLLIYNLKRVYPTSSWQLGNVIDADFITQDFNCQNCLEALKTIASLFKTEYLIEDKTINIYQRSVTSGITLKYGQDQPLLDIVDQDQTNANLITRLYAYGSTKNIENSYRDGSPNLRIGDINYIEKNVDKYNVSEGSIVFDGTTKDKNGYPLPEIYPHRTGVVDAVDNYLNFRDSSIDFNLNDYLISGLKAQVVFNTGLLAGYVIDIDNFDFATKKVTLIPQSISLIANQKSTVNPNTQLPTLVIPSVQLTPTVGDQYVFINIRMPQSYIDDAEEQLRAAAQDYLNSYCIPPVAYSVTCNARYFKKIGPPIILGQSIGLVDEVLEISTLTRVVGYTRNAQNPYIYSLELANTVKPNTLLVQILNGL